MRNQADDRANLDPTGAPGATNQAPLKDRSSENPEEIQVAIVQTRVEMSETLNAIQERLDPERLKSQARDEVEQLKERVKEDLRQEIERVKSDVRDEFEHITVRVKEEIHDATIGKAEHFMREVDYQAREASNSVIDRVRANPIPAALVGLGLAWMFMGGNRGSRRASYDRYDREGYRSGRRPYGVGYRGTSDYGRDFSDQGAYGDRSYGAYGAYGQPESGGVGQQVRDNVSGVADRVAGQVGQVGSQLSDLGDEVQNRVQQVGDQVQGQVQQVGQQVQQMGQSALNQVSEVPGQVQERFQDFSGEFQDDFTTLRRTAERAMRENPLAMGVVAMAVGAAVGMLVPETPQEERLLGDARERFMERAGTVANSALESVQERVEHVADQAENTVDSMASGSGSSPSKPSGQPSGSSATGPSSTTHQSTQPSGNNPQSKPGGQSRVA